jgi:hypothetical protein
VNNLKRRGAVHWKEVAAKAAKANASTGSHGQTNGLAISIVSVLLQSTEPGHNVMVKRGSCLNNVMIK